MSEISYYFDPFSLKCYELTDKTVIVIYIDNKIKIIYSLRDNMLFLYDISKATDQNFIISKKDENFLDTIKDNIGTKKNSYDNHESIQLKFNYATLNILKYSEYDNRFIFYTFDDNKIPHIIITCRNDDDINKIYNGLELLCETIKDEYKDEYDNVITEYKNKMNNIINNGVIIDNQDINDNLLYNFDNTYINPNEEVIFTYDSIKNNTYISTNKDALKVISSKIYNLKLSFPKKLIPSNNDSNNLYSTVSKEILNGNKIIDYIFALSICNKYNINIVFDVGCKTGIQSYLFNQNNINYIGIDDKNYNVFPFISNVKNYIRYYNKSWPKVYRKNDNFGLIKKSYKDSLVVSFNSINLLKEDGTLNEVYIRTLINHHNYVLATIECIDDSIVTNSKIIKDNCKEPIIFKSNKTYRYILLMRKD